MIRIQGDISKRIREFWKAGDYFFSTGIMTFA